MRRILILMCGVVMISSVVFAEDAVETCAGGAGTVVTGIISGRKYCSSKNSMNWFNAVAWCDAIGRRLFKLSDCECSDTTANCAGTKCPELMMENSAQHWTATAASSSDFWRVTLNGGIGIPGNKGSANVYGGKALCY